MLPVKDYTDVFPNATMSSEWDVIAEIWASLQQLGTASPQIEHILVTRTRTPLTINFLSQHNLIVMPTKKQQDSFLRTLPQILEMHQFSCQ